MANPLFAMMQNPGLMQRFQQFQQTFKGDPRQKVQELLNSGRVTQDQYNQAVQMAQQFQKMMGR